MIREQILYDFNTFRPWNFYTLCYLWICSTVFWFIVYGKLNRIFLVLLCWNYINLNYVELIHCAFQVYFILLLFCLFILSIFESFILKLQLKILIYLLIIIVIYNGIICNFVLLFSKSPGNVLLYCHNFKNLKKEREKSKVNSIRNLKEDYCPS